jgi:hypothetical protein
MNDAAPELSQDELHRAGDMAGAAWKAGALVFTDAMGRRIRLRLTAGLARGGGYWYASHYDEATGRTVNVYVGTHRGGVARFAGGRSMGRPPTPPAISPAGLAKASERIAAAVAGASPAPRCACCGRRSDA